VGATAVTRHVAPPAVDLAEPRRGTSSAGWSGAQGVTAGDRAEPRGGSSSAGRSGAQGVTAEPSPAGDRAGPHGGLRSANRGETSGAGTVGLSATATVAADLEGGRPRIRWTQAWPIVLRPTGNAQVHLVHGAGGPLGGDVLALDVRVGTGAALAVRSAGATIVQPGRGSVPARWDFDVVVGAGGSLDWAPEPTVVTDGADYRTSLRINLGVGARAIVREVVVLGRHGGVGGRFRGRLDVSVDGNPLLAHTTLLDGADPALCGPGGTAGARAVGTLILVDAVRPTAVGEAAVGGAAVGGTAVGGAAGAGGALGGAASPSDPAQGEREGVRWAWTDLAGPGRALFAVGEPGAVIALLAAVAG
jgi:urease accessory protein